MTEQKRNILILGNHDLRASLTKQYEAMGDCVTCHDDLPEDLSGIDEFVFLTNPEGKGKLDDNKAVALLPLLAGKLTDSGRRPLVHMLLQSQTTLWLLQTTDLAQEVTERLDICPFTLEDVWAKNILVRLPMHTECRIQSSECRAQNYPSLDREPIDADSQQTVHLVISGFDTQAEAVAIHAALVAHFPNYRSRDEKPLRTRITIIDSDFTERRDAFIARYQHLFDNSFYRSIDVKNRSLQLHRPMYHGRRMDFVDVEWEFVEGTLSDTVVREHLSSWAANEKQQLSIGISHNDDDLNLAESTSLPQIIYDKGITIYVRQADSVMADVLRNSGRFPTIFPFGMKDCGYNVQQPLWRLAQLLNYFYACSYGGRGVPTVLPYSEVEEEWAKVRSLKMRLSSVYNVMTIATKLHSLGHNTEDADTYYALTKSEIEILSVTEHNRWSVDRLISGSRPCTDDEREEIRRDISRKRWYKKQKDVHYDLCAYEELQVDETGKNVQEYDYDLTACIPLMAKTFFDDQEA